MDIEEINKCAIELKTLLTQTSAAIAVMQGIEVGFFDWIPANKPITVEELSRQMSYDISRVERWLRFAVAAGLVTNASNGYMLTLKGSLLRRGTPVPDLLGLFHMISYFTKGISNSKDAFQKGMGLDNITQGRITRDYIPRVASQLSKAAAESFKWAGLSTGHTILDLGCGDGSILRETVRICHGVSATGMDLNIQTLELGKRKNAEAGLQDQIELLVGDVTDLSRFKDGTYDWVCAINVFHFLPLNRREKFLQEMIRISRYGIFVNQVITNNIGTLSVNVLSSTMFTDFTGFFSQTEADELIHKAGIKHHLFLPIIQGESRMVVAYTSKNDVPLSRIAGMGNAEREKLSRMNVQTAKELLLLDPGALEKSGLGMEPARKSAIKLLFP